MAELSRGTHTLGPADSTCDTYANNGTEAARGADGAVRSIAVGGEQRWC